jgi:2-phospho-L-lactate/phosphoenolpyruvate guanylyltransferase
MTKIFAIVPVKKFENSKMRLSPMLTLEERVTLSSLMLDDTLSVLTHVQLLQEVLVVSGDTRAEEIAIGHGAKFLHEEKDNGVNSAVMLGDEYAVKQGGDATMVIPQDLPFLDHAEVGLACAMAENESKCIVICPSLRYDGTNLLIRKPSYVIKTYYDTNSYEMHVKAAENLGVPVKLLNSKKLMFDIDIPADVKQLAKEPGTSKTLGFLKSKIGKF